MDSANSTTLFTFLFETKLSARIVEIFGSWDNFSRPYTMERDERRGRGVWVGCHKFTDIICDGELVQGQEKRDGGLKMGGTYWYYYRLDGDVEHYDALRPFTTNCPLLPGQRLNILEVPIELSDVEEVPSLRPASPVPSVFSLNPQDKFQKVKPPPAKPKKTGPGIIKPPSKILEALRLQRLLTTTTMKEEMISPRAPSFALLESRPSTAGNDTLPRCERVPSPIVERETLSSSGEPTTYSMDAFHNPRDSVSTLSSSICDERGRRRTAMRKSEAYQLELQSRYPCNAFADEEKRSLQSRTSTEGRRGQSLDFRRSIDSVDDLTSRIRSIELEHNHSNSSIVSLERARPLSPNDLTQCLAPTNAAPQLHVPSVRTQSPSPFRDEATRKLSHILEIEEIEEPQDTQENTKSTSRFATANIEVPTFPKRLSSLQPPPIRPVSRDGSERKTKNTSVEEVLNPEQLRKSSVPNLDKELPQLPPNVVQSSPYMDEQVESPTGWMMQVDEELEYYRNNSIWSLDSMDFPSPPEDVPTQSPTYSSLTASSCGVRTPQRYADHQLSASQIEFRFPAKQSIYSHRRNSSEALPGALQSQYTINSQFQGYSLPAESVASETTLTKIPTPVSAFASPRFLQDSREATVTPMPASQMDELVDDFGYLGDLVIS